jgi:UDP-N-acetyl-D-galactosamine dehydrogenase
MGERAQDFMTSQSFPEKIAIVGLGYVGLPLASAFGRNIPTIGYDHDASRIDELREGVDRNKEMTADAFDVPYLTFTCDAADLAGADIFIVAVPTPVDDHREPDLGFLQSASRGVGVALAARATQERVGRPIVVFESTVYPGCTEEECLPILEAQSGLRSGVDFAIGYSPERTNFGDPEHTLGNVVKIVAGQDAEAADTLARLYGLVVMAGVHVAPDIQTAEAAKVIENVQRDLNIALMNELAVLMDRMEIDSTAVFEAARTKWNFLPFEPGLVGGHCIPVDPYYLTYRAQALGIDPNLILAGRAVNDHMAEYVADRTIALIEQERGSAKDAEVLLLGLTFKETVADARNTQVVCLAERLVSAGLTVSSHDPLLEDETVRRLGLDPVTDPFSRGPHRTYHAIILAVPHKQFMDVPAARYAELIKTDERHGVIVDIRSRLTGGNDLPGVRYWCL